MAQAGRAARRSTDRTPRAARRTMLRVEPDEKTHVRCPPEQGKANQHATVAKQKRGAREAAAGGCPHNTGGGLTPAVTSISPYGSPCASSTTSHVLSYRSASAAARAQDTAQEHRTRQETPYERSLGERSGATDILDQVFIHTNRSRVTNQSCVANRCCSGESIWRGESLLLEENTGEGRGCFHFHE